jgi:hypothetical protein
MDQWWGGLRNVAWRVWFKVEKELHDENESFRRRLSWCHSFLRAEFRVTPRLVRERAGAL